MTNFTISEKLTPCKDLGLKISKLSKSYKPAEENNPISSNIFFADPTSVEYNGRLYVYGTNDSQQFKVNGEKGENHYGGINTLFCYSSADLINWTYHGDIPVTKIATWAGCSWAPSIVSREVDGKTEFYLYFCNSGGGVGVLTSDSPTGPWSDPIGKALVHNGMLGDDPVCWCFDPGVVIDDNGVGWLAFGGGGPMHEGETSMYTGNCRLVKLGTDMVSLDSDFIKVPAVHHFEANELNYINGTYVLTYCSNYGERDKWTADLGTPSKTCSMCYMLCSGDPLNPDDWKYGGEYLTNPNTYGYPFSNNHTHLHKFADKYYILYQSVSLLENMGKLDTANGYRSIGIDEIEVDEENVVIKKGTMTDKGVCKIADINAFDVVKANTHHSAAGIDYEDVPSMGYVVTDIDEGDYILVKNVNFADSADAFAAVVDGNGIIEVRLDNADGKAVGNVQFDTNGYEAVCSKLNETVSGTHDLYLVFGGSFKFDKWQFANLG
ncbi:MAG: family 43 glycosylhydrolase [Oscillospiraceae bacterium]|nr:family 43 glycosylhydrolase [Oscillospiraceae bacterium]